MSKIKAVTFLFILCVSGCSPQIRENSNGYFGNFVWDTGFSNVSLTILADSTFEYYASWDFKNPTYSNGTWRISGDTLFLTSSIDPSFKWVKELTVPSSNIYITFCNRDTFSINGDLNESLPNLTINDNYKTQAPSLVRSVFVPGERTYDRFRFESFFQFDDAQPSAGLSQITILVQHKPIGYHVKDPKANMFFISLDLNNKWKPERTNKDNFEIFTDKPLLFMGDSYLWPLHTAVGLDAIKFKRATKNKNH